MRPKVIVSLTAYPARLACVKRVLAPIFRQTVPPDEVVLWLAKEQFSPLSAEAERELALITELGAAIRWRDEDIKPHKKYFYVMQENPDDIIITIDDDIVYPLTLVQDLLDEHFRWPRAVVANRTHLVHTDEQGKLLPYARWRFEQQELCDVPRSDLVATGAGGILYPPHAFDASVFDMRALCELAPLADDMWLMAHEIRLGIPVVNTKASPALFYVPNTQEQGLYLDNLERGGNDVVLAQLFVRYPQVEAMLLAAATPAVQPEEVAAPSPLARLRHRIGGVLAR